MRREAPAPAVPPAEARYEYVATMEPGFVLAVEATLAGGAAPPLSLDASEHVPSLELETGAGWAAVRGEDPALAAACRERCRLRYRVKLGDAARALDDVDVALLAGDTLLSPPSSWLLRPEARGRGTYAVRLALPPGMRFASGLPERGDVYTGSLATIDESTYAAFGALTEHEVAPGIRVVIAPGMSLTQADVLEWVRAELAAVSAYAGGPVTSRLTVLVAPGRSEDTHAKTLTAAGASVVIRPGTAVTAATLRDDWVLAHELVHVAFPSAGYEHSWLAEGLATYAEPVARVRAGLMTEQRFFRELLDGMPQGLPGPGDRGLAGTRQWGRLYWGGALFFLLADLGVRERTGGARSLEDALHAWRATLGDGTATHPLATLVSVADRATGTTVFSELHARLVAAPGSEDLDALWAKLGVSREGDRVVLTDAAPLAAHRADLLRTRAESAVPSPPGAHGPVGSGASATGSL